MNIRKHFDAWSVIVIATTLILFVAALFVTGFTHDLLLEAGVFLVSLKLILMAYKNSVSSDSVQKKLDEIHSAVQQLGQLRVPNSAPHPDAREVSQVGEPSQPRAGGRGR
jgi:hypothetical protein